MKKKTVTFAQKPDEIFYVDAKEERNGSFWVSDRIRFNQRIAETAKIIEPCLFKKTYYTLQQFSQK